MTFARWGIPTLFWATVVLGWGVWLLPPGLPCALGAGVAALLWLFTLAFFRNPARTPQGDARCLVAPADGVISDITQIDEPIFIRAPCIRIGIFLSVFDVHVNRSPIAGQIAYAHYRAGRFLDARHPDVSHENEANTLGLVVDAGARAPVRILVRQLSGLIARRIICTHGVGDHLQRGELFGMIKFGSRTELWLPVTCAPALKVTVGQRVLCGHTVLAELGPEPVSAPVSVPVPGPSPVPGEGTAQGGSCGSTI